MSSTPVKHSEPVVEPGAPVKSSAPHGDNVDMTGIELFKGGNKHAPSVVGGQKKRQQKKSQKKRQQNKSQKKRQQKKSQKKRQQKKQKK